MAHPGLPEIKKKQFNRATLHLIVNLPKIVINERILGSKKSTFFTLTISTIESHQKRYQNVTSHALTSKVSDYAPELIDEEDDCFHGFISKDIPGHKCVQNLLNVRDGDTKKETLKSVRTYPSRMKLLCNLEFDEKFSVGATKEFLLPLDHHDIAYITSTTQDNIHL